MADQTIPDIRQLAVQIATSYTRANPTSIDTLPTIIQLAYRGLASCIRPPEPPAPEKPATRGRRPGRPPKRR
ncbi:MAG TPA: hypothetical protein VEB20_20495 [Azospirillaceae bacterium]|nr:hypothetical protein [Azospirillaceae bacterium]